MMALNRGAVEASSNRSWLKQLLLSPEERRLRAGWRIILHLALLLAFAWLFSLIFDGINSLLAAAGWPKSELDGANSVTSLVLDGLWIASIVTTATWIARRFLDRRSLISLGFHVTRHAALDLFAGFLLAGATMMLLYAIESMVGWLHFQGWATASGSTGSHGLQIAGALFLFICAGYAEELIVRGYEIQNLRDGTNLSIAIVVSSIIFAMSHLSDKISAIALIGFFLGGLLYAYAWWRTGNLWLPIGMHVGWNFVQSAVLGYPVSGGEFPHLIDQTISGPVWITGGIYGPEGGVIRWLGTIILFGLLWLYLSKRPEAPESRSGFRTH